MGKVFIDTNVLAYPFDRRETTKAATCTALIQQLAEQGTGVISTQVMQELFNCLTRKLILSPLQARGAVERSQRFETVSITPALVREAIDCSLLDQLSIWDALMLVAAESARCTEILSEDLNHGQVIRGVRVVNPFKT